MTLLQPYAYWTRNSSTSNAWGPGNPSVFNRVEATRSVLDLHVRTVMRASVSILVTNTAPPPPGWWSGITLIGVAEWTPQPSATISGPFSGAPGIVATSWLQPTFIPGTGGATLYGLVWEQNQTEHARVFRKPDPANSDYPSVQAGIRLQDTDGAFIGGYSITVRQRVYLETLWNSSQPS